MKTLLKLVVVVTLLVIAVLVTAPLLFKEQVVAFVKDNVVDRVEKQTGRRLSLTGDIGFSVFPWLGIDLGAASLGNAPGFEDKPFLQSQKLQLRLRLLPLLKKQLELDTVVIEGLVLNLYRNQSGKTNWEDLIPKDTPGERKGGPLALASLALAGVKLADADVSWEDRQQNTHYALRDLDLETGAFSTDKPIPLDLAFDLDAPAAGVNGRFSLNSEAKLNLEAQQYHLAPLGLQAQLKGRAIPEGKIDLALSLTGEADLKNQTAALTGLVLKGMGAEAKGEVHAREILGGAPLLEGNLVLQAANLAPLLKTLQQEILPC
jgi:AsmA protein